MNMNSILNQFYKMIIKIIKQLIFTLSVVTSIYSLQIQQHLPALRQTLKPDIFKSYQIQQQQTLNILSSPQSQIVGKLYKQCHVHDPYIEIQTLSHFDKLNKDSKYLYSSKFNVLYILTNTELVRESMDRQKSMHRQQLKFNSNCSKEMVLQYAQEKMFVFDCEGIHEIFVSKNLVKASLVQNQKYLDIKKAIRLQDLVIILTYTQGVIIYTIDLDLKLNKIHNIRKMNETINLQIMDAYYQNKKLYLLDKTQGLIFYKRQKSNFIYQDSLSLDLQEQIQYNSLQIWNKNIFISLQGETESMVVQLQRINNKIYLIRYYKGYDQIIKIQIVNNSLTIHSNYKIDVFPINRDARIIKSLLNGYTYLHDQAMISFQYLYGDIFLIQRISNAIITKWSFIDKKIQCQFKDTGVYNILLQQPCELNIDNQFNSVCQQIQIAEVTVYHKDTYVWLLLVSIGIFIAATLFLIYWRENKVSRIVLILQQIKGFQRKKKQIEFKQVNFNDKNDLVVSQQQNNQQTDPYEEYISSGRNNLT